jgi:hypothetical protein
MNCLLLMLITGPYLAILVAVAGLRCFPLVDRRLVNEICLLPIANM